MEAMPEAINAGRGTGDRPVRTHVQSSAIDND